MPCITGSTVTSPLLYLLNFDCLEDSQSSAKSKKKEIAANDHKQKRKILKNN